LDPNKPSHYEASLQRDIDLIRGKVSEMFSLDKRALQDGLKAVVDNSRQAAYGIILRDQQIDDLEKQVDRLCLEFLVRQQPVALHLRFAYATIKINQELERIGDYAESIARQVLKTSTVQPRPPGDLFEEIAKLSTPMLEDAVHSFLNQDPELARRTMEIEDRVDLVRNNINAVLYGLANEGKLSQESLTPFLTIARRFERVSDQAKNICEEVIYMCTGEYAKHQGTEVYRILFVDDHDACRSQMAEGIANSLDLPKMVFTSAGLDPRPVDPETVRFLKDKGIDISRQTSKSMDQVPNLDHYQVVVALSERAKKFFPKPPTKTVGLDWHCPDPSTVGGGPEEKLAAYEQTYQCIQTNIQDLSEAILNDKTA
jgi:phosphate transport system protein